MPVPPRLYKYESLSPRSLENLKAQILYFGSPLRFNDPYDCALTPNIRTPSDQEVEQIRSAYPVADPQIPPQERAELATASTDALRQLFLRVGHSALSRAVADFLKRIGVTCFSERNDDLLMWSHYGGRYKGFCLEFATAFPPFEKIMKVTYRKDLPAIDLAPLLASDNYDQVLELFCTKSEAWGYEAEWRAIHAQAGTRYTYPTECLTGVYFGPDISRESLEIICLILGGQNETVKFWCGKRSTTEFKVVFEHFTYTPHLEAKRQGLL
jgi:hypothetical protein